MSRNERGASGATIAIPVVVIVAYVVLLIWQRSFMPHTGAGNMAWWQGWLQGLYAGPNFIINLFFSDKTLEIYQSGAGGWYQFWYLIGIGGLFSGIGKALSGSKRR